MLRFKVLVGRKDRFVVESPMHAPMRNGLNTEEFGCEYSLIPL
jgi:hypothetical protein